MALPTVCQAIEQQLVLESGRIGSTIYRKTLNRSPWLTMVNQGTWPEEMGSSADVSNPGGAGPVLGGACYNPAVKVPFAQTLRTYNLQQMAMESPDLCLLDLRNALEHDDAPAPDKSECEVFVEFPRRPQAALGRHRG